VGRPWNGLPSKFIQNASVRQEHSRSMSSMSRSIAEPPNIPNYALAQTQIFHLGLKPKLFLKAKGNYPLDLWGAKEYFARG